ncbi:MAG TPA: dihydroorotase [Clostridiaceae bacterium]|nr:dihydroorotase [Clostridiaceae bacterium]
MVLKNIRYVSVNEDKVMDIHLDDGSDKIVDAKNLVAIPGLVDMHCHLRDPGYEYKEDIASGVKAAAKGGFVKIACMPNTKPVIDNSAVVSYIREKAESLKSVKVYPIGAISKNLEGKELAEIGDMKAHGAVAISDDGNPVMSSSLMKKAMIYAHGFGMPVISHCEDKDLAEDGSMNEGFVSTVLGLRGIPKAAEEAMVAREIILAEYTGLPVHIAHVSTRLAVHMIRDAKKRGVKVTCETCPHYFTLTDETVYGFNTYAKVNPPLREKEDVKAIIEGLKDGTIDAIATDHAPHHDDEKKIEFQLAANGISGFETAFGLSFTYLVKAGHLSLGELVEKMSIKPLEILKIEDEGLNLTIFDPDEKYVVEPERFVSKGKNSPFGGFELFGEVMYTVVDGRIVYTSYKVKG